MNDSVKRRFIERKSLKKSKTDSRGSTKRTNALKTSSEKVERISIECFVMFGHIKVSPAKLKLVL